MTKKKAHQKKVAAKQHIWPRSDEVDVSPPQLTTFTFRTPMITWVYVSAQPIDPGVWVVPLAQEPRPQYPDGYEAGASGCPLSDNPYDLGTYEHRQWTEGWNAARSSMMSYTAFHHRNYERHLAASKRPVVDPDVQELLDDNVHALRFDINEPLRLQRTITFSLYDDDDRITVVDNDDGWRKDEEII